MRLFSAALLGVLVIIVSAGVYGALLIRRGFSAQDEPSGVEKAMARTVRNMSIPRSARIEENPWKDSDTAENEHEARERFADQCAICHGNDGSGRTQMGLNMYPKAPDMRLPATQNLTDGQLYYIINKGIRLTGMPGWGTPDNVENDDIWKLVLFIRHLPKLTPEDLKDMQKYNPKGLLVNDGDNDNDNGGR